MYFKHKIVKLSQKSAGIDYKTEKKLNPTITKVLPIQYVREADQNKYFY